MQFTAVFLSKISMNRGAGGLQSVSRKSQTGLRTAHNKRLEFDRPGENLGTWANKHARQFCWRWSVTNTLRRSAPDYLNGERVTWPMHGNQTALQFLCELAERGV